MVRRSKSAVPSLRGLAVGAIVAVAACTPIIGRDLGGGDYSVATRIRLQGVDEAGEQNAWHARQQCPDGFLVLDDSVVTGESGTYRRWRYGCLEPRSERGPISSR
jgi:hypothetical protein